MSRSDQRQLDERAERDGLGELVLLPAFAIAILLFWGIWGLFAPIPVDQFGMSRLWDAIFGPLFVIAVVAAGAASMFLHDVAWRHKFDQEWIEGPAAFFGMVVIVFGGAGAVVALGESALAGLGFLAMGIGAFMAVIVGIPLALMLAFGCICGIASVLQWAVRQLVA
ncbi:hypothetical protein ACFL2D_00735 [Patescibacteria group bacterium]